MASEKTITYTDGSKAVVRTLMIDNVMVERSGVLGGDVREHAIEYQLRLMHHALARSGQLMTGAQGDPEPFDVWLARVEDFEIEDGELDPTTPEAPPASG